MSKAVWLLAVTLMTCPVMGAQVLKKCSVAMTDVTLWLNWDNVECTSDSTATYNTSSNETSWDTALAHTGTGTSISNESALSGSCGVDVATSAAASYFTIDDHAEDGTQVPETEGSIGIEASWSSGSGTGYHLFRCVEGSNEISVNVSSADGDLTARWQSSGIGGHVVITGASCDNIMGDNARHIIELRRGGAGGAFELLVDGASCGVDTGNDPNWGGTSDCYVYGNLSTTFSASIDRIGIAAGDGDFDWNATWANCLNYIAP